MTSYQRATKLAAAPIGAGLVITSTFFGQKTSTCSVNQLSAAATKTLLRRQTTLSTYTTTTYARRTNQAVFPRLSTTIIRRNGTDRRPLSTSIKLESSSSSTRASPSIVQWYESHLQKNPVYTKMATGSFLWGLGDFVAQIIPSILHSDNANDDTGSSTNTPTTTTTVIAAAGDTSTSSNNNNAVGAKDSTAFVYDYQRTARAVFFGFAIHAPLSHLHFNFLEWMTIRGGFAGLSIPIFKTAMEQFVYWSWISNSLYHASMGAMQGMTYNQITDRISNVLMDTQKAQWVFWIPIQLINFRFVPVRHQLNVVLTISVVWTALMSSWYPPEGEEKGDEDGVVVSTDGVGDVRVEERSAKTSLLQETL